MRKHKRASTLNIEDNDDLGFVTRSSGGQLNFGKVEDLPPLEESDADEGPVIVNAHDFVQQTTHLGQERKRSLTPPRRTVQADDEVIYRDKGGRRITREQWLLLHEKRGGRSKKSEPAQELAWGKGLVQKEDHEARAIEELKIAQQPLNRYDIDEEYDQQLKDRNRWNDPMYNTSAPRSEKEVPKSRFTGVPNRFNIEPGYRWDGVIRGNGYEERWFKARAHRAAKEQSHYLNNIADM